MEAERHFGSFPQLDNSCAFAWHAQMPEDYEKERWEKDAEAHGHMLLHKAKLAADAAAAPAPAVAPAGIKA